jgi:hypothetical protein
LVAFSPQAVGFFDAPNAEYVDVDVDGWGGGVGWQPKNRGWRK